MQSYFVSDFLEKLLSAEPGEDTWNEVETHFKELGFCNITFGVIDKSTSQVEGLISNVSKSWMDYYYERNFHTDDPFAAYVFKNDTSCIVTSRSIDSFIQASFIQNGSTRAKQVYLGGAEVGVKSTFLSPFHNAHDGKIMGFNLGSGKECEEFERFSAEKRNAILQSTSLAQAFAQKFIAGDSFVKLRQAKLENGNVVTERELEVLNWLASGNRVSRIAEIMNISDNTVNFHIKSLKRKLNAKTREHVVAIGFLKGLIR